MERRGWREGGGEEGWDRDGGGSQKNDSCIQKTERER